MAGIFGKLWGSITGDSAEEKLRKQRGEITAGRDAANSQYTNAETAAHGAMDPYVQGGRQFYDTYKNLLGMGTPEDQQRAWGGYLNNDVLQKSRQLDIMRAQRASNAGGNYGGVDGARSGVGALADSRVNYDNSQRYLQQVAGGAAAGQAAAGTDAQISQWGGAGRAGADMGAANGLANSYGESAKNANTFGKNLFDLFGTGGGLLAKYYGWGNNLGGNSRGGSGTS